MSSLRTELHVHLYGCINAESLWELGRTRWQKQTARLEWYAAEFAKACGTSPPWRDFWHHPSPELLRQHFEFRAPAPFSVFQAHFNLLIALLPVEPHDPSVLEHAIARDIKTGLEAVEYRIFLPPQFGPSETHQLLTTLSATAANTSALDVSLAVTVSRDPHVFERQYAAIRSWLRGAPPHHAHRVTGLDFCGVEESWPPEDKRNIFAQILSDNAAHPETALAILYHVGESFEGMSAASSARWVTTAALQGAHRLGHGIALGISPEALRGRPLREDPRESEAHLRFIRTHSDLLAAHGYSHEAQRARQNWTELCTSYGDRELEDLNLLQDSLMKIIASKTDAVLEVCPTSNERIARIARPEWHQIHRFLKHGLRVCVGADDPGILATSLPREEQRLKTEWGLADPTLMTKLEQTAQSSRSIMLRAQASRNITP